MGNERIQTGLSTGEGLIWAVRDPVEKMERVKERGQPVHYEKVEADPGVEDKRLLIIEPEYANVLKQTERQGNTLSGRTPPSVGIRRPANAHQEQPRQSHRIARQHDRAHHHRRIEALPLHHRSRQRVRQPPHVHLLPTVEMSAAWRPAGRSCPRRPSLPTGRRPESRRQLNELTFDEQAGEIWDGVYADLSAERPGLTGAILGRAEAHVLRLSLLYAALDGATAIQPPHLMAASALSEYGDQSVRHIWGDALGDPVADELLRLLRASPDGVTRTQMNDHFGRNQASERIGSALTLLAEHRLAVPEPQQTGGRPREVWRARGR